MRVAVLTADTRGGVEPYVALAVGLRAAGHDVVAVAPGNQTRAFADHGLAVTGLSGDFEAAVRADSGVAERGTLATVRLMLREVPRRIRGWTAETREACRDAELVLGGIGGMVVGHSVAEAMGVPFVQAHLQPVGVPTDRYPGVLAPHPPAWAGRRGVLLSHALSDRGIWMQFRTAMRRARRDVLGLSGPMDLAPRHPVLFGFSRHVVPVPQGPSDPASVVTGYWRLGPDPARSPPAGLAEFLARPGPAFSIGFGSMPSADAEGLRAVLERALERIDARAVLVGGAPDLRPGNAGRVHAVASVPHDWLFPRVDGVVHHGGAGTTGAAIAAGRPSLVVPFAVDQPFWGRRVHELGAGPRPIPRRALTADALAAGLVSLATDGAQRERAAALGALVSAERGVERAVVHVESMRQTAARAVASP